MKSIFISRDLETDDRLHVGLTEMGFNVHANSLIEIQPLPFSIPSQPFDWVFLASKNAAKIFLADHLGSVKIAVAGKATADAVRAFGLEPTFIGSGGDMIKVGKDLAEEVGSSTVLFPMAESGSGRIRSQLNSDQVIELPIYQTIPASNVNIPETDVVFLTSPSNSKVYLENGSLKEKSVIAIGTTTRDFLSQQGIENVLVPEGPNSKSVLSLIRGL